MNTEINRCFMRFRDRAEKFSPEVIAETFVSVGPLLDILSSYNNQIMYGRRGTGKTHALRYFQEAEIKKGNLSIYIDAQNLGSNGSIYNDIDLPIRERATRLFVDVCNILHQHMLDIFTAPASKWDLSKAAPLLDNFIESFIATRIDFGQMEQEETQHRNNGLKENSSIKLDLYPTPKASVSISDSSETAQSETGRKKNNGVEESWIDFNFLSKNFREIVKLIAPARVYILVDEWSNIPMDIQPYLADMIRRTFFTIPEVTIKIGAIEHRSVFKEDKDKGGYIGFELGADITAAINLDDYLVVDNDADRANAFFKQFIANHAASMAKELSLTIPSGQKLFDAAFTQQDNVFLEFVRATEGVPRDGLHILTGAAQKANTKAISMIDLRSAAHSFFLIDKYNTISANKDNKKMLDWIRDKVIGERQTRAFLLQYGKEDKIIDVLFDSRALHIANRSRSAAHRPGERFIVYKLDYGMYIELVYSNRFPKNLLVNEDNADIDFEVPFDNARSYRRAILDLDQFYTLNPEIEKI